MSIKLTVSITSSLAEWLEKQAEASGESSEEYCIEILTAYHALEMEHDKPTETEEEKPNG